MISKMLLTPFNSTNPWLWGLDLKLIKNGHLVEPYTINQIKSDFPVEFDFFNEWCGKNPEIAREYYK